MNSSMSLLRGVLPHASLDAFNSQGPRPGHIPALPLLWLRAARVV